MKQPTQLTAAQIQRLFDFTEENYVNYIDLRYELVDHLATGIEEQLKSNPKKEFDLALKHERGKFPLTGFYLFIEEKEKALQKYWNKKIWSVIKSYYKLPQLLMTLTIFIPTYFLYIKKPITAIAVFFGIFLFSIIYESYLIYKAKSQYLFIKLFHQALLSATLIAFTFFYFQSDSTRNYKYRHENGITPSNGIEQLIALSYAFSVTMMLLILIGIVTGQFYKLLTDEIHNKYAHLGLTN